MGFALEDILWGMRNALKGVCFRATWASYTIEERRSCWTDTPSVDYGFRCQRKGKHETHHTRLLPKG